MKPFHTLTYRGQVRRLRQVAQNALLAYDLPEPSLRLISHGENTTFRVEIQGNNGNLANDDYAANRFLLRIHRPTYQNTDSIRSELTWLAALRNSGMIVPEPVPTTDGALVSQGRTSGTPDVRVCSLLRWINGRFIRKPAFHHFAALGRLMAQLHGHAHSWTPPADFRRRRWDMEGLFGDDAGFALPPVDVWSRAPARYRTAMQQVAGETEQVMDKLGQGPEVWALVHADLHLDNVLFKRGAARAIDFDDCGYAHWLYDLAVVLADYLHRDDWMSIQAALCDGYTQVRPLPDSIGLLPAFMAARHVSLLLWATDMAENNPRFAARLPRWYERGMNCIERLKHLPRT